MHDIISCTNGYRGSRKGWSGGANERQDAVARDVKAGYAVNLAITIGYGDSRVIAHAACSEFMEIGSRRQQAEIRLSVSTG
ncbi:hypothetical protein PAAL109150_06040 [Paenibacillus alkaliterrae]